LKGLDDRGVDQALIAALSLQLDQVSAQVRGEPNVGWDERVHRIRTGLKTGRATLRLMRYGMGTRAWRRANQALRDAGRAFSDKRDWDVILSSCRGLSRQRRLAPALRELEQTLVERQRRSLDRIREGGAVERGLDLIGTARGCVHAANARGGWEGVWRGVRRVYAQGRRAWNDGGRESDAERLHELRKRSKDLRFQFRLFRSLAPRWPARAEPRLEQLADRLGEERDLHLFGLTFHTAAPPHPRSARAVLEYLEARRRRLLSEVRPLATRLYGDDRRTFTERTRSEFERALGDRRGGLRRVAALTAASALAAAVAFWLSEESPPVA
jgi:CHAD domain-containing protein